MASFLNLTQGDRDVFVTISHIAMVSPGPDDGSVLLLTGGEQVHVDEAPSRVIAACLANEILAGGAEA